MNKVNVPFDVINATNDLFFKYNKETSILYVLDDNNLIFKSSIYPDKFWFKLNLKPSYRDKINIYNCNYYPHNKNRLQERTVDIHSDSISEFFEFWLDIVHAYENTKTFLDDPFLEKYQKDIHDNYLKFVDEEDDDLPYDLNTQIQFIEYLDNLEEVIKEDLNNDSVEFKNELNESLKLIGYLKENINKLTKGEVKQKFSLSLANIAKASLAYFQEIMKSAISEIAVKMITGQ